MKRILIADDDSATRGMLSRMLKPYDGSLEILTAGDGKEVTRSLEGKQIDLVVADLQLPLADGRELPAYIQDRHPEMPMILMTAFGTPELRNRIKGFTHARYFEKPLNIEEIRAAILEIIGPGREGRLNTASLSAALQSVAMERSSCTLLVKSSGRSGALFLMKGELVAAETETLSGEAAVYEILCWKNPAIVQEAASAKKNREIHQPLAAVLTEGLKRQQAKAGPPAFASPAVAGGRRQPVLKKPVRGMSRTEAGDLERPQFEEPEPMAVRKILAPNPTDGTSRIHPAPVPPPAEKNARPFTSGGPPSPGGPSLAKLVTVLRNTEGILGFRIYDEQDALKAAYDKSGVCARFKPAVFWSQADGIRAEIGGGNLQFLVISTRKGVKYTMAQYGGRRIVIAAQPGYKTSDLAKMLAH
ncbi:MAG: response regulator [Thermodesulfobacteriota bacterium]